MLLFSSSSYRNLIEEKDYRPLAEISGEHPEHFTFSFNYQTKKRHFRKADGVGSLRDTPFGRAYVLLFFSAEQISNDLEAKLEHRIREWQGDGVLGVISVDLNGLKTTNDTKGHHAGDILISETARILRECSGENSVFRTGGDEFIVLTEELEERDITLMIQHMRESAANNGISMAIGYACTRGRVTDFDTLLTQADLNMYQDKGHSFRRRRGDR